MDEQRTTSWSTGSTVSVEQKAYEDFKEYALRTHELCRYLLQLAMVVFYALPFILLIFRAMTGTDKVVLLLVWILFMFALAIFMIFVSFFDKRLKERSEQLYNTTLDELGVVGPNSALRRELQEQFEALRGERQANSSAAPVAPASRVPSAPQEELFSASAYPWESIHPFTATVPQDSAQAFTIDVLQDSAQTFTAPAPQDSMQTFTAPAQTLNTVPVSATPSMPASTQRTSAGTASDADDCEVII